MDDLAENLRTGMRETLELLADADRQRKYQAEVPPAALARRESAALALTAGSTVNRSMELESFDIVDRNALAVALV